MSGLKKTIERLEAGTIDNCINAIDAALAYQGTNTIYMDKGSLGNATLSNYKGLVGADNQREFLSAGHERKTARAIGDGSERH